MRSEGSESAGSLRANVTVNVLLVPTWTVTGKVIPLLNMPFQAADEIFTSAFVA